MMILNVTSWNCTETSTIKSAEIEFKFVSIHRRCLHEVEIVFNGDIIFLR
jgi:hypothetical protein